MQRKTTNGLSNLTQSVTIKHNSLVPGQVERLNVAHEPPTQGSHICFRFLMDHDAPQPSFVCLVSLPIRSIFPYKWRR